MVAPAEEFQHTSDMSDRPEGRTLILMIDDDRKLCRLVATYLEPLGFSVTAVHTGPDEGRVHSWAMKSWGRAEMRPRS